MRRSLACLALLCGVAALFDVARPATAAFPGANGRIVFVSNRAAFQDIYSSNADGSDTVRLTTDQALDTQPAYSPDGTKIAFVRTNDIYVMNADGSGQVPITASEGPDSQPAWSPDGSQIVYVSNHNVPGGGTTGPELFVTGAAGGAQRQLTNTPNNAASGAPAWSPAGDQIAYQSNADGGFEVYTIDAGATASFGTRRTANAVGQNYQNPSWSPDATRIAFERGIGTNPGDNTKEIWTMRSDGSDPVQLTSNTVYDVQPAYSPDCTRIAFETLEDGDREIYTRSALDGGTPVNVTDTTAGITDEQPDWGVGGSSAPSCASGPVTLADLPDPALGVNVDVQAISGTVLVKTKGTAFVPLEEARQIPVGSLLDTRKGTVALQSAKDHAGTRQTGRFLSGLFQVRQSKKRSARGLTDLVLKGSSFRSCRRAAKGRTAGAALSRRQIRRLRASARGRFRTTGRNSSATVRGTIWDVTDRCDGTLTHVKRGTVIVRDFRRKKNITVKTGKSYLAKARS